MRRSRIPGRVSQGRLRLVSAIEPIPPASTVVRQRMSLAARAAIIALVLIAEKFFLNTLVDFKAAQAASGLGTAARIAQHFGFRFAVSFGIALAFFLYMRSDAALRAINDAARTAPVRQRWLAVHCALLVPIAACLYNLYGTHGIHLPFAGLAGAALLLTAVATAALLLALAPWSQWQRGAVAVGSRWLYALAAAIAATAAIVLSQGLWGITAQVTFELVRLVLLPIIPSLQADAATRVLQTQHFSIMVSQVCSGLEGIGLMLAFCFAWLTYFRREYRFPRALLLIPVGVLVMFALNIARIATLVLIGNAGYPDVAVYGFHSQAGWIAFNVAACGMAVVSRNSRWLARMPTARTERSATARGTTAFLMPFLATLAAGMISHAVSGRFETWYGLRLIAATAALAVYWRHLAGLDWRFSWRGIAVGVVAFLGWSLSAHFLLAARGMPAALAAMPAAQRMLWIASRAATAILSAPLVEELAYRGYLLRRLVGEDFESIPFRSVGWLPLVGSAAAFGALHGPMWLPAIGVGIIYGALLIRTQRMGEAVAAHLVTNLALAGCVLLGQQWQLW